MAPAISSIVVDPPLAPLLAAPSILIPYTTLFRSPPIATTPPVESTASPPVLVIRARMAPALSSNVVDPPLAPLIAAPSLVMVASQTGKVQGITPAPQTARTPSPPV